MRGVLIKPLVTKCRICRKEIIKDTGNRKYCELCAKKREQALKNKWKRTHYIKRFTTKICPICSNVFNTNSGNKTFCTIECQKRQQRIDMCEKNVLKWQNEIRRLRAEL